MSYSFELLRDKARELRVKYKGPDEKVTGDNRKAYLLELGRFVLQSEYSWALSKLIIVELNNMHCSPPLGMEYVDSAFINCMFSRENT